MKNPVLLTAALVFCALHLAPVKAHAQPQESAIDILDDMMQENEPPPAPPQLENSLEKKTTQPDGGEGPLDSILVGEEPPFMIPIEAYLLGNEGVYEIQNLSAPEAGSALTGFKIGDVVLHWYKPAGQDQMFSAANSYDCLVDGDAMHPFKVFTIGQLEKDALCKSLSPHEAALPADNKNAHTVKLEEYGTFYRTAKAWYLIAFDQTVNFGPSAAPLYLDGDQPAYTANDEDTFDVTKDGALIVYEDRTRVVYAPGETYVTPNGQKIRIEPVMTQEMLQEQMMKSYIENTDPAQILDDVKKAFEENPQ